MKAGSRPPLRVVEFIATRRGDAERGPMVRMHGDEARLRLIEDGELVYVYGPRRHELAVLRTDDSLAPGAVVARDIAGLRVLELATVVKPDLDADAPRRNLA